jgi:PPOX class probable F420-dependent enzyme
MELTTALRNVSGRRNGVLTTLSSDGRPHLANIFFALIGDEVKISVTNNRAKVRNLRRDDRASIWIPGDNFFQWLVLEGTAKLSPVASDPEDEVVEKLVDLYRSSGSEHPDWDEFRRAMIAEERILLSLRPTRAYGMWAN